MAKNPKPTCHPGIEEDVEVSAVVPSGPTDAEGRCHGDAQVVLPHNLVRHRSDAHGDHVVGGVYDAAFPGRLPLLGGEYRDIGALAVVRAGAWVNTEYWQINATENTWLSHATISEIANKL